MIPMANRIPGDMLNISKERSREYLPRSTKKATPVRRKSRGRVEPSHNTSTTVAMRITPSEDTTESRVFPQIEVQTNIQIFRLHRIDSSTEEFTIDCGITFIWNDPTLALEANGKYYSTHPAVVRYNPRMARSDYEMWPDHLRVGENVFDPAWKILNSSNVDVIKSFTTILNSPLGTVHNFVHIRATVHQTLDLQEFPFDHQTIVVRLQSEHSEAVMKFVPFTDGRKPCIYDKNKSSEWKLDPVGFPPMTLDYDPNKQAASSGVRYACLECIFHAVRRPEWYIWNVILISFCIVLSSYSLFFIPPENTAERLSIVFTTWLMLISLKFIVSDRLPKISYLTLLDIYLHSSYVVMMALLVYVCSYALSRAEAATRVDSVPVPWTPSLFRLTLLIHEPVMLGCFTIFWVLIHAGLVAVYCLRSWYR